jgi:calcineurin-like phosphoesterase family protein
MNTFLIADTHFGHKGVTQFLNYNGTKLRPWDNTEEMDEALIENWNKAVRPKDKVYHLGDVVINRKALKTLSRLNGEKVLVKGNHDLFRLEEYTPYFKDIRGSHKLDNFILTHIPIHPDSLARWCGGNIHGHLHNGKVEYTDWHKIGYGEIYDPRYFCVSVEQINYTPIAFEEVKKIMKERN